MLPLLSLLLACGSGGPSADASAGECLGTPDARVAVDTGGFTPDPTVGARIDGDTLVLEYDQMSANCCPSPAAEVEIEGSTLTVDLRDVVHGDPCDCMCVIDFEVRVDDLDPGDWTVDALFNGARVGTLSVTMP